MRGAGKARRDVPTVSAPGKLFLAGEYGVLYGGPCLLAAVNRRARAYPGRPARGATPLLLAARAEAARLLAEMGRGCEGPVPSTDTRAFRAGRTKLGLGSSAAAAVSCLAAFLVQNGLDLSMHLAEVMSAAVRAHRTAQSGKGSGADVAASTKGGVIRARLQDDGGIETDAVSIPRGLAMAVVWSGRPASTPALIAKVEGFRERDPERHGRIMRDIGEAASRMAHAAITQDTGTWLDGVKTHHRLFRELGRAADAEIVEDRLEAIASLAEEHTGAAKPSGAGGGDLAVAFFPDPDRKEAFEAAAARRGLMILDLSVDPRGVTLHAPDTAEKGGVES